MPNNKDIRNIGIVAHVDAGKTTITEHLLYEAGVIRALGSVDKGTSQTDWLEVERARGISVRAATTTFDWCDTRINLIDTPGHVDFSAEVERSLRILDSAVLVISAVEGVQAQTEVLWQALMDMRIPTIFFINKIDRVGADVERVLSEIHQILTSKAVSIQRVKGQGNRHPVIIDILADQKRSDNEHKKPFEDLIEAVSEQDESLLMQYIDGKDISIKQIKNSIYHQVHSCRLYPVLYGAALEGIGIGELMN
ncbi:MAG: GTP-binding protein, partial [Firmicutes bacterium]|nr:GTP-binding protein [Bacillota bacterium]